MKNSQVSTIRYLTSRVFIFLGLLIIAACGSSNKVTKISSDIPSESPTTFNPAGTPATPSENQPPETCTQTDQVTYNPKSLDFGLNQIGVRECQTITVTSCFGVEAQIDPGSSKSTVTNSEDPTQTSQEPEFEVGGKTGTGRAEICYNRKGEGSHNGKAIIKLDASHTILVPLTGQTLPKLFTLTKPTDPVLVWDNTFGPAKQGDESVPYYEYFDVPVEGSILLEQYATLLTGQKPEIAVSVENGGITTKLPYDEQGHFSGLVQIPNVGRVYPITFALKTNKGTLKTTVQAVRPDKPSVDLEIRDGEGHLANAIATKPKDATVTNSTFLTAGIVFKNLDIAAPNEDHPALVQLKITKSKPSTEYPEKTLVYQGGTEWVGGDHGSSPAIVGYHKGIVLDDNSANKCRVTGFENNTLCIPLPHTGKLGRGVNFLEALVCNDVTGTVDSDCIKVKATIIVNNNLPRIVIETPVENCVYPPEGHVAETTCAKNSDGEIILKGYVENYDPGLTVDDTGKKTYGCSVSFWLNSNDLDENKLTQNGKAICPKPQSIGGSTVDKTHNSGNIGNIKKGNFEINLSRDFANQLTRYTNIVQIKAMNTEGHVAFKTVSFQRGLIKKGSKSTTSNKTNIYSGEMGSVPDTKINTKSAPIMLDISEATLNEDIKHVVRKLLNENLKFSTLAMGGGLRKDENGKVLPIGTGTDKPETNENIIRLLHGTMPEQVRALMDYQLVNQSTTKYFPQDVAVDACNQPITTAIITPDVYQYLYPKWDPAWLGDHDIGLREWPGVCYDKNGNTNPDCNTTEEGKWDFDIDLKDNGYVDVKLILNGTIDKDGTKKPAFWGHYTAYNLVDQGTTGAYSTLPYDIPFLAPITGPILGPIMKGQGLADPAIPLLMNVGKLTINLKDVLRVYKVQKNQDGTVKSCYNPELGYDEPCGCTNDNCTNMVYIDRNKIQQSHSVFTFEPFQECEAYFKKKWPGMNLPYGCSSDPDSTFPFLVDTTSTQGYLLWNVASKQGSNLALLGLIKDVFEHTFKNVVSCIPNYLMLSEPIDLGNRKVDKLMLNSMIDPVAFPYPKWIAETDKINDLSIALERKDDSISFGLADSIENPIAGIKPNIKDADIFVNDGSIQIKLPFNFGSFNVNKNLANNIQHLYRETTPDFDTQFPLNEVTDKPYASISLGIEELLHSATTVLLKKGIQPLLDLLDVTDFKYPKHYSQPDDWTIGIDKIILGRLDICGDIANKLLSTSLPTNILFTEIKSLFQTEETHWDITLDKDAPVTLNMKPSDTLGTLGDTTADSSAVLEVGLSNVKINVHDLISDESGSVYKIGNESIITVRLDAIIKLKLDYYRSQRKLIISIAPYKDTPAYVSVEKKGPVYDDSKVLKDIKETLLTQAFDRLGNGFMEVTFPNNISSFNTIGFGVEGSKDIEEAIAANGVTILDKTALGVNGTCESEADKPKYDDSVGFARQNILDILHEYTKKNQTVNESIQRAKTKIKLKDDIFLNKVNIADVLAQREIDIIDDDPCKTPDMISEIAGNDIKESLCDLGIKEISMGEGDPNIILDADNGYIHLSTQILVEIYDWVREQNND